MCAICRSEHEAHRKVEFFTKLVCGYWGETTMGGSRNIWSLGQLWLVSMRACLHLQCVK